jgi:hypothetical protein
MITANDILTEIRDRRQRQGNADYCEAGQNNWGRSDHFVRDDCSEDEVRTCLDEMESNGLVTFVRDSRSGIGKAQYITPPSYIKVELTPNGEAALIALATQPSVPTP